MSDFSIDYFSATPMDLNSNILNHRIVDLINSNMNKFGGNPSNSSNFIIIILMIIIIIIGFIFIFIKDDWIETNAYINNRMCNNKNVECKINLRYVVDSISYSKIISIPNANYIENSIIKIYYKKSDHNIIKLYNFDYSIIGIILVAIASFYLITI